LEPSIGPIVPGQKDIRLSRSARETNLIGASRLSHQARDHPTAARVALIPVLVAPDVTVTGVGMPGDHGPMCLPAAGPI